MILRGKIKGVKVEKNNFFVFYFIPNNPKRLFNEVNKSDILLTARGYKNAIVVKGQSLRPLAKDLEVKVEGRFERNSYASRNLSFFQKQFTPNRVFNAKNIEIISWLESQAGLKDYLIRNVNNIWDHTAEQIFNIYEPKEFLGILKSWNDDKIINALKDVNGIGKKRAESIYKDWNEQEEMRWFLTNFYALFSDNDTAFFSTNKVLKIYQYFWYKIIEKLKKDNENIYLLTQVPYVWFSEIDEIAMDYLGLEKNSNLRYVALCRHFIKKITQQDTIFSFEYLEEKIKNFLLNEKEDYDVSNIVAIGLNKLREEGFIEKINDEIYVLSLYKNIEKYVAKWLEKKKKDVWLHYDQKINGNYNKIKWYNTLTPEQKKAVKRVLNRKVSFLVGPAGSGKSWTTNIITNALQKKWVNYCMVAPTHKAVSRMKEVNNDGEDIKTIHSLLKLTPSDMSLTYKKDNYLPYDYYLVDETSMVGIYLIYALLKAMKPSACIVFLWDPNQLPSISPWSFLHDVCKSPLLKKNIARLSTVKRVEEGKSGVGDIEDGLSNIVANSQRILNKETPLKATNTYTKSFDYLTEETENRIIQMIKNLYNKMKKRWVDYKKDHQILIPQKAGSLGIKNLNKELSKHLNGHNKSYKIETARWDKYLREWDKIFYNSHDPEWELAKWDTGVIKEINNKTEKVSIYYYWIKETLTYSFKDMNDVELGYCMTIHKAQGSEFPYITVIITTQGFQLLDQTLLYTAYARWKEKVYLMGNNYAIKKCLNKKW